MAGDLKITTGRVFDLDSGVSRVMDVVGPKFRPVFMDLVGPNLYRLFTVMPLLFRRLYIFNFKIHPNTFLVSTILLKCLTNKSLQIFMCRQSSGNNFIALQNLSNIKINVTFSRQLSTLYLFG